MNLCEKLCWLCRWCCRWFLSLSFLVSIPSRKSYLYLVEKKYIWMEQVTIQVTEKNVEKLNGGIVHWRRQDISLATLSTYVRCFGRYAVHLVLTLFCCVIQPQWMLQKKNHTHKQNERIFRMRVCGATHW